MISVPIFFVMAVPGLTSAGALTSEAGDYPSRPVIDVVYSQLDAVLEIGFDGRVIHGDATYGFSPRHGYLDHIVWPVHNAQINSVRLDGNDISYQLDNDSLYIPFDEHPDPDRTYHISITYETTPRFGVHYKHNGTIFTSNLPGGVGHWLPGPVHPRVSMPVSLSIEVPDPLKAVANGELQATIPTNRGSQFLWETARDIPLSNLGFAIGDFEFTETFSGTKSLGLYHEQGVMDDAGRRAFLELMVRRTRQLERFLRSELPVSSMQIVVMDDPVWETRPYAAGLAFLYSSAEHKEVQLSRSLAAQWFGISLNAEKWGDYHFLQLLQAVVAEETGDADWKGYPDPLNRAFDVPETIYDYAGMDHWQWARAFIRDNKSPVLVSSMKQSIQELANLNTTWTSDDFSDFIYRKSGRWYDVPVISEPEPSAEYRFHITVEEVRGSDKISLRIIAEADITDRQFPLKVMWERGGEVFEQEKTFSGRGETIELDPGGHVSNVRITDASDLDSGSDVQFTVAKPFSHWLYQLRRDEDASRRKEAARALEDFVSDPDLQLALQDIINREDDPEVLAQIYRVMADITSGASGTERRFIDGISSNNEGIRQVSMEALQNYSGNTRVEEEVLSVIQSSDDIPLVNTAIRTYRRLIEEAAFRDFAIRFLQEDRREMLFTKTLLEELFAVPAIEASIQEARQYLNAGFPFEIRWLAYRLLREHAAGMEWQEDFIYDFSDDPDPRMRFITLYSISSIEREEQGLFLKDRMLYEYDIRILRTIEELLD